MGNVLSVKDQCSQFPIIDLPFLRTGQPLDNLVQDFFDTQTRLGADVHVVCTVESEGPLYLLRGFLGRSVGQVDLVDHREKFEVRFQGNMEDGEGLGLYSLWE